MSARITIAPTTASAPPIDAGPSAGAGANAVPSGEAAGVVIGAAAVALGDSVPGARAPDGTALSVGVVGDGDGGRWGGGAEVLGTFATGVLEGDAGGRFDALGAEVGVDRMVGRGVAGGVGRTVGRGIADGVGAGLDGVHTPTGDGGTAGTPVWASYRKPSASPLRKVWLETPRLEVAQGPSARETNIDQYGLEPDQQLAGKVAGSPSIWQTASPKPPNVTVA